MIFTFSSEFWKQSNRTLYEQKTGEQTEELEGASRHFTSFSACLFCLHLLSLSIPWTNEDGSGVRIRGVGCVGGRVVRGERTSFTGISFTLSSVGRVKCYRTGRNLLFQIQQHLS